MKNFIKSRNVKFAQNKHKNKTSVSDSLGWTSPIEYFVYCLVNTLGLGNIWRFPYEAFQFGGGTFLVTYVFVCFLLAHPLCYLEIVLGQFLSKSNLQAFKALAPGFAGISWCQAMVCIIVSSYYSATIAFLIFYLVRTFLHVLPWNRCDRSWESSCVTFSDIANGTIKNYTFSEELFLIKKVLNLKSPEALREGIGNPNPEMVMYSLVVWIFIFVLISRGFKSLGHFVYIVLLLPFFILLALVIRVTHFEGSSDGILYLFGVDWINTINPRVLRAAVMQSCFSLTLGTGVITTLASYNKLNYPAKAISILIVCIDLLTSLLYGILTFGAMGHLAWKLNTTVTEIPKYKAGMIFVYYLEAIDSVKCASRMYSFLFFFTILMASIGCLQGLQMVIINHLKFCFPNLKNFYFPIISTGLCFGLSNIYFTSGGAYLIKMVNDFGCDMVFGTLIIATLLAVCYSYGLQNFCWDIEFMNQRKVGVYWRAVWSVLDLSVMCFIMAYTFFLYDPWDNITIPLLYKVIGWLLFFLVILPIPLVLIYTLFKNGSQGCSESARRTFTHEDWGPSNPEIYNEWKKLKFTAKTKRNMQNDGCLIRGFKTLMRTYD